MKKFRCEKCKTVWYSSSEKNNICETKNCDGKLKNVSYEGLGVIKRKLDSNNKNLKYNNIEGE